nr:PREDICTED: out at first protein [Bemisia tabaci]
MSVVINVFTFILCVSTFIQFCDQQLLINVQNQGGDVLQETISANVSEDVVTLEFQRSDGTLITQLVDFRHEVMILKTLVLGEEERGQSQYQVMCFLSHINKDEFISSDAMAKLRQKNPGTIRVAEMNRGQANLTMDLQVDVPRSVVISKHVVPLCNEAADSTYTRLHDINTWSSLPGASLINLMSAVKHLPNSNNIDLSSSKHKTHTRCMNTMELWAPCTCQLELCIGWYPCGLKYCKSASSKLVDSSYRCGIKTCKKCYMFRYHVKQKQFCLWDEV